MPRAVAPHPDSAQSFRLFAFAFAAGYLLFSGVYSYRAPYGWWVNYIWGHPAWGEHDPGCFYVEAAHQLAWGKAPLFVGHPGSTLLLLLLSIQRAYYAVSSSNGLSFTQFTARHLPTVFLLSKLLMTVLHLVSFLALFAFTMKLVRDRRAALFASLGYATSFPVLYCLSRISVEPLMTTFFLAAFLAMWRYQELATEGRIGWALVFVALAGCLAVSGAVTKFNFLAPLPFFLALYVLAGGRSEGRDDPIGWRTRTSALAVFGAAAITLMVCYSQIINWQAFFSIWTNIPAAPVSWQWQRLLPARTPEGVFMLTELAFIAIGAAGWVTFLLHSRRRRSRALWVSAYAAYTLLVWAYRCAQAGELGPFHYFLLSEAVLAVFFGHLTALALRRFPAFSKGWRLAAFGLIWLGLIHGVGVWAVVDSRRRDVLSYAPFRAPLALISQLSPSQRLGVETPRPAFHDLRGLHCMPSQTSAIRTEFETLLVPVDARTVGPDVPRLRVPLPGSTMVVLGDVR